MTFPIFSFCPRLPQGSVYQKTNAMSEIKKINKDNFWAQAEVGPSSKTIPSHDCHMTIFTFRAFYTFIQSDLQSVHLLKETETIRTFVESDSNISLWCIKIRIEDSSIHNCKVK